MSATHPDIDRFRDLCENRIPFNAMLGVRMDALTPGFCRLLLPFQEDLVGDTRRGACHGGVLSMLADTCGGFAVWSLRRIEDRIATIDLRVDYLKPAVRCDLAAEAHVRLLGNRVGNAHIIITPADAPGEVLAEGRGVYNVRTD
ncbi:MAG: PaaI family thioesterase [Desulfovibrionaceae bacterium]